MVVVADPRDRYWWPTDWRIRRETHADRRAADAVNADSLLERQQPFGTLPS